jgi:hypothetical protein
MGRIIQMTKVKQRHSQWCWAACCEMFVTYHGKTGYNQEKFAIDAKNVGRGSDACHQFHTPEAFALRPLDPDEYNSNSLLNDTAEPSIFVPLLHTVLPTVKFVKYTGPGKDSQPRYLQPAIKNFLDANRIMLFGQGNHVRILCGYLGEDPIESLVEVDPASGETHKLKWSEFDTCDWIVYVPKQT